MLNSQTSLSGRLIAIDGLRGASALAVVVYHLYGQVEAELSHVLPSWLSAVFKHGYLGVPVFFVLSGFVITASVKTSTISLRYIGRFALRRSIRLDLVYWTAIALALMFLLIKQEVLGFEVDYPSMKDVALHSVYLQDVFHLENQISAVFWTLCLEIQFYIFFVISVYVCGTIQSANTLSLHSGLVALISLLSSLIYSGIMKLSMPGFFLPYWSFFAMGCLCYRALNNGGLHSLLFLLVLVSSLATTLCAKNINYILGASAAVIFIFLLGIMGWLKSGLSNIYLQFLGAISYSLYLTHPDIGWKSISVLKIAIPESQTPVIALGIFSAGVVISIGFAYLFYKVIEQPSHLLSKKIAL